MWTRCAKIVQLVVHMKILKQIDTHKHWLRVLWAPALGLHEGSFGPQPISSSVGEKRMWNSTCQVYIILVGNSSIIYLLFSFGGGGQTLEGRSDGISNDIIWVYTKDLCPPKHFGL